MGLRLSEGAEKQLSLYFMYLDKMPEGHDQMLLCDDGMIKGQAGCLCRPAGATIDFDFLRVMEKGS